MAALLDTTLGEYRLVELLGVGGMGEVYRAVHRRIGRVVAVKVLTKAGKDPTHLDRFLNEARIQAGLSHPNIAQFYDFVEHDGYPCIIMEFVDGQTVYEWLKRHGAFPVYRALPVMRAVTDAIAYLHGQGILHRDIKSNNIKLTHRGEVKLLDFGIAKAGDSPKLTQAGSFVGTLQYLAPEQIQGQPANVQTEVWSLGVLFYELLAGRTPFEAQTLGAICARISKGETPSLRKNHVEVSTAVERVIGRCLAKSPDERYPSVQGLLEEIDRLSEDLQRRRYLREARVHARWRNPTILVGLASALMAAIVPCGMLWYGQRAASRVQPAAAAPAPAELQRVRIDTPNGRSTLYLYNNGRWEGPFQTPYEFMAPLGRRVDWMLQRPGYQARQGTFDVEVHNEHDYTLCKIGETCGQ